MDIFIVGIDTGGTFTDFVLLDQNGQLKKWKVLSTPSDPSRAIVEGLKEIIPDLFSRRGLEIVHGTTVGTNAFLERKGAKTCLITTRGFEDVLFIGRQARPRLYDFYCKKPREIISRNMVLGVEERCDAKGDVITPLKREELEKCVEFARAKGVETVAICLLHSYLNPEHEREIASHLEKSGIKAHMSSALIPEFREFERTSTTVINAYLGPIVGNYINSLNTKLPGASILIQQSSGGCRPAAGIEDVAATTILSGPAGGVLAGLELGKSLGISNILTFDMGGTSTDVSLCPGHLVFTREYKIEGYPINLPVIDVHTVGAGGGSIAWIDKGGLLKVGPRSAGADPGPVCYGKGQEITVTDANLFLGRLRADKFLGGRMSLHTKRVEEKMQELASRLGLSPTETALGIIKLVNINMVQALRQVSIERGYDPREFHLVSFGGAAGLHALSVADELGVPRVIIPEMAGVFSAQGLASSDLVFEASRSLFWCSSHDHDKQIDEAIKTLEGELLEQASNFGHRETFQKEAYLDVRYKGQSFEIMVPYSPDWMELFHQEHQRLYGYMLPDAPVEITATRLKIIIPRKGREVFFKKISQPDLQGLGEMDPASIAAHSCDIIFESGTCQVPVIEKRA
ncbi:MAG: hydantoinase/oxoprolinase family protein, partial [Thermodesulfobacteria bacterium]|nr:hydantoinase/oxoprolinase family protein [Thermodesulfobacteriota bacterium]